MPTDPQSILLLTVAAFVLPVLLGRVLATALLRSVATLATALIVGLPVALFFDARAGLLAAAWSLTLAALGTDPGFLRIDASNRRWWDHFGG